MRQVPLALGDEDLVRSFQYCSAALDSQCSEGGIVESESDEQQILPGLKAINATFLTEVAALPLWERSKCRFDTHVVQDRPDGGNYLATLCIALPAT